MSSKDKVSINGVTFMETLQTTPYASDDGFVSIFSKCSNEDKRHMVVASVLELIKADLLSGSATNTLEHHIITLNDYSEKVLSVLNGESDK